MRGYKNLPLPGADDPTSLVSFRDRYMAALSRRGYSAETVEDAGRELHAFIAWAHGRSLWTPTEITRDVLEDWRGHLFDRRKPCGAPLSFRTQLVRLTRIRGFFRWLARENHIPANPASELELPRPERRLPSTILSADEAERVLKLPDVSTALGLRDRAMLELFYATAMRRSELARLKVGDVDYGRGLIVVRQGKGKKDRMVPTGPRAMGWLEAYRERARPRLLGPRPTEMLFVSRAGTPLALKKLSERVSAYIRRADLGKAGSCHLFRHTAATLMLEGGADIRFIQALLGHESLQTTQVYTRVSIAKLAEVHAATHPSGGGVRQALQAGL